MKLFTYWRSSAAYRVRIGLHLKALSFDSVPVHLVRQGGEQNNPSFAAINPQRLIPALELEDGQVLIQSLSILEYLDETYPEPPLLPSSAVGRAQVRALAQIVSCDIHPLNNLRVTNYLAAHLNLDEEKKTHWYLHWMTQGFAAFETLLTESHATGRFCHGNSPTLADICLVPQLYNAHRFSVDLSPFPTVRRIGETCLELPAFRQAVPENQADAE